MARPLWDFAGPTFTDGGVGPGEMPGDRLHGGNDRLRVGVCCGLHSEGNSPEHAGLGPERRSHDIGLDVFQ